MCRSPGKLVFIPVSNNGRIIMPFVNIRIVEGHSQERKDEISRRVVDPQRKGKSAAGKSRTRGEAAGPSLGQRSSRQGSLRGARRQEWGCRERNAIALAPGSPTLFIMAACVWRSSPACPPKPQASSRGGKAGPTPRVGAYQHCSAKHLKLFVGEFDFRYNGRGISNVGSGPPSD